MVEEFEPIEFKPFEPEEKPGSEHEITYEQDRHTIKVEPTESFKIPEINLDKISEIIEKVKGDEGVKEDDRIVAPKIFGLLIRFSNDFLNRPYITDDFSDHKERRKWREKLEKDEEEGMSPLKDIYKNNCLDINSFGRIGELLGSLIYGGVFINIEDARNLAEEVKKSMMILASEYDKMDTATKVKYVKDMKKKLYELLVILSKV